MTGAEIALPTGGLAFGIGMAICVRWTRRRLEQKTKRRPAE